MTRESVGAAIALFACIGLGCSAAGSGERESLNREEAKVVHVVDGDTFDVELADGAVERIRPPQIDTPENEECGYDAATSVLEALVLGREVRLVPTVSGPDRDDHGRLLRAVEVDGHDVGEVLLTEGLARWVPHFADEDPRLAESYEAAESEARVVSAGLWAACDWS